MASPRKSLALPDIQFKDEKLNRLAQAVRAILSEMQRVQQVLGEGDAGEILVKNSTKDYDAGWSSAESVAGKPGSVWRSGDGVPSNSLGVDGDFYLDALTGNVYQRVDGAYEVTANIEGPQGPEGAQGNPGTAGPQGASGPAGANGLPGLQGIPGPPGTDGEEGAPGDRGPPGSAGARGPQGVPGPTGPSGGPAGPMGPPGFDGEPGEAGPPGDVGPTGPRGPTGASGATGAPGGMGAPGLDGEVGEIGPWGPPGARGAAGTAGPAGPTGAAGAAGPRGVMGPPGTDGEPGEPGMWGPPGPQGPAGSGGGPAANITPDTHPASPTAWDDEFEFGTTLDTSGSRRAGANAWSTFNVTAGTTVTIGSGSLLIDQPVVSGSTDVSLFYQAAPSGTWTIVAKMSVATANVVGLYAGSHTGKFLSLGWVGGGTIEMASFNSTTSFSGGIASTSWPASGTVGGAGSTTPPSWVYLAMSWDGTQVTYAVSASGVPGSFLTVASSTFLGAAPAEVGFCSDAFGGTSEVIADWFRRTA